VLGVFVLLGIGALDLPIAMDLLSRTFTYLPQILIAIAILVLGSLVSAVVRRTVLIGAVNAGLPSARLLAGAVHTGLLILFAAMALEHLASGARSWSYRSGSCSGVSCSHWRWRSASPGATLLAACSSACCAGRARRRGPPQAPLTRTIHEAVRPSS